MNYRTHKTGSELVGHIKPEMNKTGSELVGHAKPEVNLRLTWKCLFDDKLVAEEQRKRRRKRFRPDVEALGPIL
jgi:hypothetical protein